MARLKLVPAALATWSPGVTHPWGEAWLASGEGNQSPESSHWSLSWGLPQAHHTLCGTDVPQNFNDLSLTFLLSIPFSGSPCSLCFFLAALTPDRDFPGGSAVKHLPAILETWVRFLGQEDPLEKEMAIHSSTLALKIPWTEEPDRLQSMRSQSVGHD